MKKKKHSMTLKSPKAGQAAAEDQAQTTSVKKPTDPSADSQPNNDSALDLQTTLDDSSTLDFKFDLDDDLASEMFLKFTDDDADDFDLDSPKPTTNVTPNNLPAQEVQNIQSSVQRKSLLGRFIKRKPTDDESTATSAKESPDELRYKKTDKTAPPEPKLTDTEHAQMQAKRLGVEPVLNVQDIPKDVKIFKDEIIDNLIGNDNDILVLDNGQILVVDLVNPKISNLRVYLRNKKIPTSLTPTTNRVITQLKAPQLEDNFDEEEEDEEDKVVSVDSDISRYLENLIADVVRLKATDVHIETRDTVCQIKVRLDGRLSVYDTTTSRRAMSLGYLLFNALARRGAKEFVTHKALDAACDLKIGDQVVSLRLATAPEARGFDIIIRILAGTVQKLELDILGYNAIHLQLMRDTINLPYGVMLMSGPVGSGKSTSLMSLVSEISIERKVVSLEDPVEMTIGNVTHVPILEHIEGATWDDMLKGLNRWDSNVVVAGEVRDQKTCYALQKMCTSGRLAMSTIHASNALAIPTRMEDLGADHSMLYDPNFLVCLVNQRLVPALCKACNIPLKDKKVSDVLQNALNRTFKNGIDNVFTRHEPGCPKCHEGLSGRQLLAEVIKVDSIGRKFIKNRDQQGWGSYLNEQGWEDMSAHALQKIDLGLLDPLVVKNIVPIMEESSSDSSFSYSELQGLING